MDTDRQRNRPAAPSSNQGSARHAGAIARGHGGLGKTLRETEAYLALNERLAGRIPESARGEIRVACVEGDCLVIAAASSARATQARLLADTLLQAVREHWPGRLARTRVIVMPGDHQAP